MLATLCTLTLIAQGPMLAGLPAGHGGGEVLEVRGPAELTRGEAFESARREALDLLRSRYEGRGREWIAGNRPFWLPTLVSDQVLRRWSAQLDMDKALQIVDRDDRQRFHEFGDSFQTTLSFLPDLRYAERAESRLHGSLRYAERAFLYKTAGTAGFWALLALVLGWVDRLSRGYMTGRLWAIGIGLGAVVPVAAFLL